MSTEPQGLQGEYVEVKRIRVIKSIDDICGYKKGGCDRSLCLDDPSKLCYFCRHKKVLDVPEIIKWEIEKKNGNNKF